MEKRITVEDMINEGSITAKQAMYMGLKFDAVVIAGDIARMRSEWLRKQSQLFSQTLE